MSEIKQVVCDVQGPGCLDRENRTPGSVIQSGWTHATSELVVGEQHATMDFDVCPVCAAPVTSVGQMRSAIESTSAVLTQRAADVSQRAADAIAKKQGG